jgi:thiol-disulfide isomerase/thioredoxin
MTSEPDPQSFARKRFATIAAGGIAGVAVGLAAVYGIATLAGNAGGDPACRPALDIARRIAPLARGEMAAVNVAEKPLRVPELTFLDGAGRERTLSEWRGRTLLLNLWATWCVPCRKEMPALDALQEKLGASDFEVVAVNIDTRDGNKPKAWFKDLGIKRLAYYADPNAKVFQDLKMVGRAFGMPTTLVIDPNGCEIGTIAGPAEWSSDDAVKLLRAALNKTSGS